MTTILRKLFWHLLLSLAVFMLLPLVFVPAKASAKKFGEKADLLEDIADMKGFKKLLRSRTNVLVFFTSNIKKYPDELKLLREASEAIRGFGALAVVECDANAERKKVCKKLKVTPDAYILKHFKNGDFHKDYDRQMSLSSIVTFMNDPTGSLPWEEDPVGKDVLHFDDYVSFTRHLLKDSRPMMVMFYAPWCGFCTRLKLPYSQAATELKQKNRVLAAINMDKKENAPARRVYNISGFPTLAYFESGTFKQIYDGDKNKEALVDFLLHPNAKRNAKETLTKEASWSSDANSDIVHLTTEGFLPAIRDEKSVLVMFYAPWCGHCKNLKPEYEKAAAYIKEKKIPGILAAVDTAKETRLGEQFEVRSYPTLKYFADGQYKFDVNIRNAEALINFMKDPKEPVPVNNQWEDEDDSNDIVFFSNDEDFSKTLKRKRHALIMFYAPWCGHCKKAKPEFTGAAKSLKDDTRILFGAVDCSRYDKLCKQYDVKGFPTIVNFSYYKTRQLYSGDRTSAAFIDFMTNAIDSQSNREDL